jgi:hypothetical protein
MRRPKVFLCAALIAVVCAGCVASDAAATSSLVPGFLIGTWRTDTESHRNTFLRLTATTIAFGTVEGTVDRNIVEKVTRTQDWFGPLYTIEYRDMEGQEYHLDLYFDDQTLRLRNQRRMEWKWSRF